jgi:hypothetical protein
MQFWQVDFADAPNFVEYVPASQGTQSAEAVLPVVVENVPA